MWLAFRVVVFVTVFISTLVATHYAAYKTVQHFFGLTYAQYWGMTFLSLVTFIIAYAIGKLLAVIFEVMFADL